jgi:hypothetical protein
MELDATKPIMVRESPPHTSTASFIVPQGIDPLLFFGGATLGCMGTLPVFTLLFPSLTQNSHI